MAVIKKTIPQWEYQGQIIDNISKTPQGSISFIYKITLEDGRYYLGRKTMLKPNYTSGVNKGKSRGEYPWKSYNGSSKELLKILKEDKPNYKKEILQFCYTKTETSYAETCQILCGGALTDPLCFNYWIKATIYAKNLKPNS